jgi:hypothetical protein
MDDLKPILDLKVFSIKNIRNYPKRNAEEILYLKGWYLNNHHNNHPPTKIPPIL